MERLASWRRFWLRSAILFAHSLRTSISLMQKVYLYFIYIYKGYLDNVNRFQSRKQLVVADDLVNFSFKNSAPNVVERRTWLNAERRGTLNAVKRWTRWKRFTSNGQSRSLPAGFLFVCNVRFVPRQGDQQDPPTRSTIPSFCLLFFRTDDESMR